MASNPVAVTVRYKKQGTLPPIFVAGSFSDPEWQPEEMQYTSMGDNEYEYYKEVHIRQGKEYQYKFRIGEGDWWVLNEDSPSGTDNDGNRNNLLKIPISGGVAPEKPLQPLEERPATPTSEMDNLDAKSIEERMGTREPSDVLFDDEITREEDVIESMPEQPLPKELNQPSQSKTSSSKLPAEIKEVQAEKEKAYQVGAYQVGEASDQPNHATSDIEKSHHPTAESGVGDSAGGAHEAKLTPIPTIFNRTLDIPGLGVDPGAAVTKESDQSVKSGEEPPPMLMIKEVDAKSETPTGGEDDQRLQAHAAGPGSVRDEDRSKTPDFVNITAEVADSAAILDPREPTPPISDEEAGLIGYRRISMTPIPQIADTAAEVADSAAALDTEEDTPPVSDEEAGRVGYRRMSYTPIPEVAATAAEVADSAAQLDWEDREIDIAIPVFESSLTPDEIEILESGRSTPESEKVPRFPHELPTPLDQLETEKPAKQEVFEQLGHPHDSCRVADPNNPCYEPFPTDRGAILQQLRIIQERLPEDETHVDIDPAPAAVIFHRSAYEKQLEESLLKDQTDDRPIPQHTTPETRNEEQHDAKASDRLSTLSCIEEESTPEHVEVKPSDVSKSKEKDDEGNDAPVPNELPTLGNIKYEPVLEQLEEAQLREVSENTEEIDSRAGAVNDSEALISIEATNDIKVAGPILIQELEGNNIKSGNDDGMESNLDGRSSMGAQKLALPTRLTPPTQPSQNNPITIANRQLGHENEETRETSTSSDSPAIILSPATPAESSIHTADPSEGLNGNPSKTSQSTSIESDSGLVRSRKQSKAPVPERPLTPNSVRSAGKDAHERNFIKAFWRVFFVDWIGGLILRLCGGNRRRNALMAVGVIAVVGIAPALYLTR